MQTPELMSLAAFIWAVLFTGLLILHTQEHLPLPFCTFRDYAKTANSPDMPEKEQA